MKMGMEFWMAHIMALKLEAVPVNAYAKRHDLAVQSLYYWRRKLDCPNEASQVASTPAKSAPASQFVALRMNAILTELDDVHALLNESKLEAHLVSIHNKAAGERLGHH